MLTARARWAFGILAIASMPLHAIAQPSGGERITIAAGESQRVLEDRVSGNQTIEYRLKANRGQHLSVDLASDDASVYFNIKSASDDQFLFAGMMAGNVADVAVPADGDYLVQVFLVRAAARRGEQARYTLTVGLGAPDKADGLAGGPDYWQVQLEDAATALNVRSGPGPQYAVTGKLANAQTLQNRGCRLSGEQRWCDIRAAGSGTQGWVAGRFLIEGSKPAKPEGGPERQRSEGNEQEFDATGQIDCVLESGQPAQSCSFGVIRDGPGNAGVWVAIPSQDALHILFESGMVTAVGNGRDYVARKVDDHYEIDQGMRHFVIPQAVIDGG